MSRDRLVETMAVHRFAVAARARQRAFDVTGPLGAAGHLFGPHMSIFFGVFNPYGSEGPCARAGSQGKKVGVPHRTKFAAWKLSGSRREVSVDRYPVPDSQWPARLPLRQFAPKVGGQSSGAVVSGGSHDYSRRCISRFAASGVGYCTCLAVCTLSRRSASRSFYYTRQTRAPGRGARRLPCAVRNGALLPSFQKG